MSLLLLANPTSGGGKGAKLKDKVIAQLTLLGKEFIDISGTSYESALVNLRESKKRHQGGVVIVIGGDGMVHLAIQELASSNFAMLLIPAGTGNDFARSAGLSIDKPLDALDLGLREPAQRVDLGRVNDRFFAEILSTGFDSLVNERANRIHWQSKRKYDFAMLLIPAGTGNDFARSAGLSIDKPLDALDLGLREPAQRVDLGRVNDRFFAEILSTGFDSLVNERANRIHWQSKRKYDFAMLLELPFFKPLEYQIELDSRKFVTEAMLIAVANGASYGGGMKVCPDASLTDGFFDVMILEPVSKFEFLRVFPKVFKGTHITHPRVRIERARSVNISAPAVAYADGERIGPLPIKAEIAPNSLLTWIAS